MAGVNELNAGKLNLAGGTMTGNLIMSGVSGAAQGASLVFQTPTGGSVPGVIQGVQSVSFATSATGQTGMITAPGINFSSPTLGSASVGSGSLLIIHRNTASADNSARVQVGTNGNPLWDVNTTPYPAIRLSGEHIYIGSNDPSALVATTTELRGTVKIGAGTAEGGTTPIAGSLAVTAPATFSGTVGISGVSTLSGNSFVTANMQWGASGATTNGLATASSLRYTNGTSTTTLSPTGLAGTGSAIINFGTEATPCTGTARLAITTIVIGSDAASTAPSIYIRGATTISRTLTVSASASFTSSTATTFSTIPTLPASDPTTANQAVRKAYVDGGAHTIPTGGAANAVLYKTSATNYATGWSTAFARYQLYTTESAANTASTSDTTKLCFYPA